MNEKLLYYLWQQQLTNKPMTTTDQRELVVKRAGLTCPFGQEFIQT